MNINKILYPILLLLVVLAVIMKARLIRSNIRRRSI